MPNPLVSHSSREDGNGLPVWSWFDNTIIDLRIATFSKGFCTGFMRVSLKQGDDMRIFRY